MKGRFDRETLDVTIPIKDNRMRKIKQSLGYRVSSELAEKVGFFYVHVPESFPTDYASVPRVLWSLLPPTGRYTFAAIIHDYLYVTIECERRVADAVFYDAMRTLEVPLHTAFVMWVGVRVGGWVPWGRRAKAIKQGQTNAK
jgi:hypothetical protein